jgi:hypothetical protein
MFMRVSIVLMTVAVAAMIAELVFGVDLGIRHFILGLKRSGNMPLLSQ